ncbi:CstA-like transporter-associated (seleno)protein [Virgisporangium aurantiacum]|uniref:YbdD/YjiX family protein n=1 Tax=Virgisporangium aurantiacum TaxID=175570 RepID=A0A8J3Z195_9ACTN|nr:YbdD/YjiX family protein [Virgisporangium aurantiacum]GIJ54502.1 hypothetical protein Vau01_020180 [Virgisporangium aurantiacum]
MTTILSKTWWYVKAVMGEDAYDLYLAHRHRQHTGKPVLTRREFEQAKTKPNVRCC